MKIRKVFAPATATTSTSVDWTQTTLAQLLETQHQYLRYLKVILRLNRIKSCQIIFILDLYIIDLYRWNYSILFFHLVPTLCLERASLSSGDANDRFSERDRLGSFGSSLGVCWWCAMKGRNWGLLINMKDGGGLCQAKGWYILVIWFNKGFIM